MREVTVQEITCEYCGETESLEMTFPESRMEFYRLGWRHSCYGGKEGALCPSCIEELGDTAGPCFENGEGHE